MNRTPRSCPHPQTPHRHGTRAAYHADRCRCTACSRANSDYETIRVRLHAYLGAAGLGLKKAAAETGTSERRP